MSEDIAEIVDQYQILEARIFEHCGYKHDWRVFPMVDDREHYWHVDPAEREEIKFSPRREALEYWLGDHDDEYGEHGDHLYSSRIYTYRHFKKYVYRGPTYTLVLAEPGSDMNLWLMLLDNAKEIK